MCNIYILKIIFQNKSYLFTTAARNKIKQTFTSFKFVSSETIKIQNMFQIPKQHAKFEMIHLHFTLIPNRAHYLQIYHLKQIFGAINYFAIISSNIKSRINHK